MEKDVFIKVRGVQFTDGNDRPESVELFTIGSYYKKEGRHFLRYSEVQPEETAPTLNTVKISPDSVDIIKNGTAHTHLIFSSGQKTLSLYHTPYGQLSVALNTRQIRLSEDADCLTVEVRYSLELNEQHVADCHLEILAASEASLI